MLSNEQIDLNPAQFKRKLGNLPQQLQDLPEQFRSISREELQEVSKVIFHDLVDYAFGFTWGKGRKKK